MLLDSLTQARFLCIGQLEHLYLNHYTVFYPEFGVPFEGMWKYATENKSKVSLSRPRDIERQNIKDDHSRYM